MIKLVVFLKKLLFTLPSLCYLFLAAKRLGPAVRLHYFQVS
jgi:hypothetical protein